MLTQWRSGSNHAVVELSRVARAGFTSAFLSGFVAIFYFRLLDHLSSKLPVEAWLPVSTILRKFIRAFYITLIDIAIYEPIYDTIYLSLQARQLSAC